MHQIELIIRQIVIIFVSLCKALFLSASYTFISCTLDTLSVSVKLTESSLKKYLVFFKRSNDKVNRYIMSEEEVKKKDRESPCVKGKPQVFVFNLQVAELLLHISIQV